MSSLAGISPTFGVKQVNSSKKQRFFTYAVKRSVFSAQHASVYYNTASKLGRARGHVAKAAETGEEQKLAQKPVQIEPKQTVPEEEHQQEQQQEQQQQNQGRIQRSYAQQREVTLPFGDIQIGEIYSGKVERLASFGAFVNIGSDVEGLVHISQLAYEFVSDPAEYVQVGQVVQVKVLDKNDSEMKISLTMKIQGPPEGGQRPGGRGQSRAAKTALEDIEADSVLTGRVVRVAGFGAFVDVGAETDGLVHVSQLSNSFISDVSDVVEEGDEVQVRVLEVDLEKRQLRLSMKGEQGDEDEDEFEEGDDSDEFAREKRQRRRQTMEKGGRRQSAPPPPVSEGESITGPIKRVAAYGVFIDIGGGFQAMLHKNEMKVDNSDPLWQVRDFFKIDQDVTVTVQKVEENKIELTQKSQADRDDEQQSKAGYTAAAEEDIYKPSLFANAFASAGILRAKFPSHPERAIVDPPEDLLPDIVQKAIEEVVEEEVTDEVAAEQVEEVPEKTTEEVQPVVENAVEASEKVEEVVETVPEVPQPTEEITEAVTEQTEEVVEKVEESTQQEPVVENVTKTEAVTTENVVEQEIQIPDTVEQAVKDPEPVEQSIPEPEMQQEQVVENKSSEQISESAPVVESVVPEQDAQSVPDVVSSDASSEASTETQLETKSES